MSALKRTARASPPDSHQAKARSGRALTALACALTVLLASPNANAEEVLVQNDSVVDLGEAWIVGDFIAGEHAGARLTSPCDGNIVAVQILWLENTPGHGDSLEQAIHIYDGSTFPTPGSELELLEGPVMSPGYWNEFRYLDEAQSIPLIVPVTTGQQFTVTLEFFNPTDVNSGGPSVVRDVDGCQSGRNVLFGDFGAGLNWWDFCLLLQGDLAIRAIVDCPGVTGACCYANGNCAPDIEQADCEAEFGATWHEGLDCAAITCNPRGACCRMGGCLTLTEQGFCEGINGVYAGPGTNCDDNVCVTGACCMLTGECSENFGFQCQALGGTFGGPGTTCNPNPCPQPEGACCFDQACLPAQTEAGCTGAGGAWAGPFTDCGPPNPCAADPCSGIPLGDYTAPAGVDGLDIGYFVDALLASSPSPDQICRGDFDDSSDLGTGDVPGMVTALLNGP